MLKFSTISVDKAVHNLRPFVQLFDFVVNKFQQKPLPKKQAVKIAAEKINF